MGGAAFAVGTVSFVVATLAMAAILICSLVVSGVPAPNFRGLSVLPWWGWLGGFAGATYVTTVFTAIPVIGASATIGLTVAGQQIAAVFVDKFAWFRLPQRVVSPIRLVGVAVLLAGVAVIKMV
jgi:transporter family-2 protein